MRAVVQRPIQAISSGVWFIKGTLCGFLIRKWQRDSMLTLLLWEGPYNNLKRQAQFVAFKATYHENTCKKLSIYDELTTIEAIVNQPSLYLHEVQYIVLKTTGNNLSISTIFKFLQKENFTRKKLTFRAQQRSDELRAKFRTDISSLSLKC